MKCLLLFVLFFQMISSFGEEYILMLGTLYCQFQCSNVVHLSRTQNRIETILQQLEMEGPQVKFTAIPNN